MLKARSKAEPSEPKQAVSPDREASIESELVIPVEIASTRTKVFISYRSKEPDLSLAHQFYEHLQAAGHEVFMAGASIRMGDEWPRRVNEALESCDYFLLLLSPQSATSEMVIEEVRQAKFLHDTRPNRKPTLLPIRMNLPMDTPLNYDLRGYLQRIQQGVWNSSADSPKLLQEILSLIAEGRKSELNDENESEEKLNQSQTLEDLSHPPLPVADPELPEGQVDLTSPLYMERLPIEFNCYETILTPGALIRIKAP